MSSQRTILTDFDLESFWKPSDYALKEYVGAALTDVVVSTVQRELGYELPASYLELMRFQNGGIPQRTNHRTEEPTSWAHDHIAITGLYSIGRDKRCSLCGEFGSQFWVEEWGYPPIGVYFADCPSAGHDMLCLDYRACGANGEPQVVHIDQEWDYKIVLVAESFETFIRGLEDDSAFE
jgi:SMI1-KNR4 cell-wall